MSGKKNIAFQVLLTGLLLCGQCFVYAQRYPFYNLNVENGLIQSQVRGLVQDRYGHLWIGTLGGLSRFDGKTFTSFTVRDGMLDNEVTTLAADRSGKIWIGGAKGLSVYDGYHFDHYRSVSAETKSGAAVSEIHITTSDTVWCVSGGKIYAVTGNGSMRELIVPERSTTVRTILPDNHTLWVATTQGSLYRYQQHTWDSLPLPVSSGGKKITVNKLFKARSGTIWLAAGNGIFRLSGDTVQPAVVNGLVMDNLPAVLSLTEDRHGALWLGMASGVLHLTDSTLYYFNKKNGLSDNSFLDILPDREGNVWLASDGNGVFRFSGSRFTVLDETTGLPSAQIMSLETDGSSRLFLGTYDAGLYVYESGKVARLHLPFKSNPVITSLCMVSGTLWIGTGGEGLWLYDGRIFKPSLFNQRLPSSFVTRLYKDMRGRIWIGTLNGGGYYTQQQYHPVSADGMHIGDIIDIGGDSILLATPTGIQLVRQDTVTRFITGSAPDSVSIQCFTRHGQELWIGSSDNGLIGYHLHHKTAVVLNKNNGMRSDFVYNVIADDDGHIWAGTGYGIHQLKFPERQPPLITFYGKNNGITGMESNHNAVLKMSDGSIWFGTTNGAVHYRPKGELVSPVPAGIVIQSVKLFGERLMDSTYADSIDAWYRVPYGLKLPHKKNNLSFTFHALTLSSDQISYRYRISGEEVHWSDWSDAGTVSFPALQPGKYLLEIQCLTTGEQSMINSIQYPFEIIAPFHKTRWFSLLILLGCILLGVSLQYAANRRKQNRKQLLEQLHREAQHKVRERTAEDFHDEIGNRLTRINILTNILKNKMSAVAPDTERIINQIQENTAELYGGTRDILWSLKPSNDNLYEVLHRIRDFGGELFQDTDIVYTFDGIEDNWKRFRIPIDVSRNLIMIFKEALNNSLKYANAAKVTIKASLRAQDVFHIELTDDGSGFDIKEPRKGQGLNNMQQRASRINGRLYIDTEKGRGTIIVLTFRLPQEYPPKRG